MGVALLIILGGTRCSIYSSVENKNKMAGYPSNNLDTLPMMSYGPVSWDPFNSKDWDKEKATSDCILRIKR